MLCGMVPAKLFKVHKQRGCYKATHDNCAAYDDLGGNFSPKLQDYPPLQFRTK